MLTALTRTALIVVAFMALPTFAFTDTGAYIGGRTGMIAMNVDFDKQFISSDIGATAYKEVLGGVTFNKNFALEAGYFITAKADATGYASAWEDNYLQGGHVSFKLKRNIFGAEIYGSFGMNFLSLNMTLNGKEFGNDMEHLGNNYKGVWKGYAARFTVGGNYELAPNLKLGGEVAYMASGLNHKNSVGRLSAYNAQFEAFLLSLTVEYHFNLGR